VHRPRGNPKLPGRGKADYLTMQTMQAKKEKNIAIVALDVRKKVEKKGA